MKILLVVPYFEEPHRWMVSGEKTAHYLSRKHQVVVVTTGQKARVEKPHSNLTIYRLKDFFLKDPINYSVIPFLGRQLKKIVAQERPDAFLINKHMFYSSLAVFPLKQLGVRVIVQTDTFPGINWFPRSKLVGAVMWVYARLIGNPVLRKADTVVLLHEGLTADAKKLGINYRVIHNGIDVKKFDQTPPPTDLQKKKGDIWIGYVGRLESVKGWEQVAETALLMTKDNPRLHFFFIGPTKNADGKITQFTHPRIHFLGLRRDVAGIDKLLDIFVMPSLSEGLSNAIMEAMAASCACLASRVGGNMILIKDRHNGLLFQSGNTADFRQKLKTLISNPDLRKSLGQAARQTIETSYDLEQTVGEVAQLLKESQPRPS